MALAPLQLAMRPFSRFLSSQTWGLRTMRCAGFLALRTRATSGLLPIAPPHPLGVFWVHQVTLSFSDLSSRCRNTPEQGLPFCKSAQTLVAFLAFYSGKALLFSRNLGTVFQFQ